jgi:hypothetical protein
MKPSNIINKIIFEKLKPYNYLFKCKNTFPIKGFPTSIVTILDTNYYYNFSGSIINIRNRSYITSLKIRSRRFGAEQRFFVFAPQLKSHIVSYYLSNRYNKIKKTGKVGFEPTDGRPSLV